MQRLGLFTGLFLFLSVCFSQNGRYQLGAEGSGMANANINNTNGWSVFNNPAGLGYQNTPSVFTSYQNRLNVAAFQTMGIGMVYPTRLITPGISFFKFGDDVYNQQKIGLSISKRIQIVSLGLGLHLIQNRFSELGNINALTIDFGGIAEIIEGLRIGAHVFNINQARYTENQLVPVIMRFGLSFVPSDYFIITAELEKELERTENIKIGLNYHLTDWLSLQTGFASEPQSFSFGLGLHLNTWMMNYATTNLTPAGMVHELSLSKVLKRNEKN
jgi:hypothetical protein